MKIGNWLSEKIEAVCEKRDIKKDSTHERECFQKHGDVSYVDVRFEYKNLFYYQNTFITRAFEKYMVTDKYSKWSGGGWHGVTGPKDRDYNWLFWEVEEGEFVEYGQKLAVICRSSILGYEDQWHMICVALCDGYVSLKRVQNKRFEMKLFCRLNIRRKPLIARIYETKEDYEKAEGK